MKRIRRLRLVCFVASVFVLGSMDLTFGQTSTPSAMHVQGYLTDGGTPINGVVSMQLTIFDAQFPGGTALATAGPLNVTVTDGVYDLEVPFDASAFTAPNRFLETVVNGQVLTPRMRVASAPYAFVADTLDGFDASAFVRRAGDAMSGPLTVQGLVTSTAGGIQFPDGTIQATAATGGASGGGDAVSVLGVPTSDADFSDDAPAPPAGSLNVRWQSLPGIPSSVSAHVPYTSPLTAGDGGLTIADDAVGPAQIDESAAFIWTGSQSFAGTTVAAQGLQLGAFQSILWPTVGNSTTAGIRLFTEAGIFNGFLDNVFYQCYNCTAIDTARADPSEHQFKQQTEYTYFDTPTSEAVEVNWDYASADGATLYRPFGYFLRVTGGTPNHQGNWFFNTNLGERGLTIRNGGIRVGNGVDGSETFEVYGSAALRGTTTLLGPSRFYPSLAPTTSGNHAALEVLPSWSAVSTSATPSLFNLDASATLDLGTPDARAGYASVYANPKLSGSATGNVLDRVLGVWSAPQMGSTGAGTQVLDFVAYRAQLYLNLGSGWSANTACYFCADNVLADVLPAGASLERFFGLRLPDLGGLGAVNHAILIDAQTGGSGAKGNLRLAGGGFDSGHLDLGGLHVWNDGGVLRVNPAPPAGPSDGTAFQPGDPDLETIAGLTCTEGASLTWSGGTWSCGAAQAQRTSHGRLFWGDANDVAFDTGEEVCRAEGSSCAGVKSIAGAPSDCGTRQPPGVFYALCR